MVYQVPPSSFQPERQISSVSARFSPRTSSFKKMNLKEPYVRKKKKKSLISSSLTVFSSQECGRNSAQE